MYVAFFREAITRNLLISVRLEPAHHKQSGSVSSGRDDHERLVRVSGSRTSELSTRELSTISEDRLPSRKIRAGPQALQSGEEDRCDGGLSSQERRAFKDIVQEARHVCLDCLRDEAAYLGWVLEVSRRGNQAAGDVAKVNATEGVHGACVTTHLAVGWVGDALLCS